MLFVGMFRHLAQSLLGLFMRTLYVYMYHIYVWV